MEYIGLLAGMIIGALIYIGGTLTPWLSEEAMIEMLVMRRVKRKLGAITRPAVDREIEAASDRIVGLEPNYIVDITMTRCGNSAAPTEGAGAPEAEIEITPEMIAAGVLRLFDYDPEFSNEDEIVVAIFREMASARGARSRQSSRECHPAGRQVTEQ